ncbi:MAG: NADH-quinone oxidoreductase subunit J [Saprospiraceae bacterium]|jgi:NADH-quinone oxidoreductase subunit J|nr:NADH-quinone oxidoreductase subunit J [Saprospiraceae bacterium]
MSLTIFSILGLASVIFALLMVFTKNPVRSVIFLILTFFSIAGQYVLLNAQFLAVVHIIVYAGAVMVLFLFVLMLLNLNTEAEPRQTHRWKLGAAIAAGMLLVTFVGALRGGIQITVPENSNPSVGLVQNLGKVLFTDFVVPFEVAGILFLAAMVGAVLLGKRDVKI